LFKNKSINPFPVPQKLKITSFRAALGLIAEIFAELLFWKEKLDYNKKRLDRYGDVDAKYISDIEKQINVVSEKLKKNPDGYIENAGQADLFKKHKKEVEQYVLDKGGKIVTDNSGHTWVELPLKSQKKPINVTGNIDPKLAIGMGVAGVGALAGAVIADDNKVLGAGIGAVIGGIGAAMAMTKPKGTNPLNKVYNLPTEAPVRDLSKGAPHPAAILGEKDFNATGKEILKLHGPEAAKEFATRYQDVVELSLLPINGYEECNQRSY